MKVLIGYDGSESGNAVLNELSRAGLPGETEILVISVSDIRTPPTDLGSLPGVAITSQRLTATLEQLKTESDQALEQAGRMSEKAAAKIKSDFPDWEVQAECSSGDAAAALIEKAADWKADLIIVGSGNRSALVRIFLGSVSKKVATDAGCSVRVARTIISDGNLAPHRLIAGIDNSNSLDPIIEAIAERDWSPGSEVLLLTAIGTFVENENSPGKQLETLERIQQEAAARLNEAGLRASFSIKGGEAKNELLLEAEKWKSDCIFVGSRNIHGALNRFLAGNVSTDVVMEAPCSVEVIRG